MSTPLCVFSQLFLFVWASGPHEPQTSPRWWSPEIAASEALPAGSPVRQQSLGSERIHAPPVQAPVYRWDRTRRSPAGTTIDRLWNSHVPSVVLELVVQLLVFSRWPQGDIKDETTTDPSWMFPINAAIALSSLSSLPMLWFEGECPHLYTAGFEFVLALLPPMDGHHTKPCKKYGPPTNHFYFTQ